MPTNEELAAEIKKLKAELERVKKQLKEKRSGSEPSSFAGGMNAQEVGTITELYKALNNQFKVSESTLKNLSESGAFFVKGGPLMDGLTSSIKEMDRMFANSKAGADAFSFLAKEFKNFQQLAEATKDGAANLAGELSKQAAVLGQLGLSYGSFKENMDFAIYSMGAGADEVKSLNSSIVELSNQVGMLPEQMSRNFQSVSKSLAYNFNEIKNQFVKIQQLSNETGVSIDNLMGKFGRPMDTISGASQMAAKLNSLMGKNRFSATELLMMSEEDRMTSIRSALMEEGVAGQALAGGVQGKFAMQSVQEVLGMGLDDTRRFLQTGGVKGQMAEATKEAFEGRGSIGGEAGAGQEFVKASKDSAQALEDFRDRILGLLDPLDEVAIRTRGSALGGMSGPGGTAAEQMIGQVGLFREIGLMGSLQAQRAAGQSPEFRKLLQSFSQDEFAGAGLNVEELGARVLEGGETASAARAEARAKLQSFRREKGTLSVFDTAVVQYLRNHETYSKFGIPNKVANFLRGDTGKRFDFPASEAADEGFIKNKAGEIMTAAGIDAGKLEEKEKGMMNLSSAIPASSPSFSGPSTGTSPASGRKVYNLYFGDKKLATLFEDAMGNLVQ